MDKRDRVYIGTALKQLRAERGWSQRELAKRSGLYLGHVQFLEKNTNEPTASVLLALARALGVPVAVFFPPDVR